MLLENQASLNEQVRQAKYESARKVQKYYLKCLHQLVNGETNSDTSMSIYTYTNIQIMFMLFIVYCLLAVGGSAERKSCPKHKRTSSAHKTTANNSHYRHKRSFSPSQSQQNL